VRDDTKLSESEVGSSEERYGEEGTLNVRDDTKFLTDTREAQTYTWVHDPVWCARTPHTNITCTPSGFRLAGLSQDNMEPGAVCSMLHVLNISKILVFGDSHARHIKVALCLVTTGDYMHGSLPPTDSVLRNNCSGRRQFSERTQQCRLGVSGCCKGCDGAVLVIFFSVFVMYECVCMHVPAMQTGSGWLLQGRM
jgi:hypothetical protein